MALPKWTDERTQQLTDFVGSESPISQSTVAEAAEDLETSTRSISSKLRKMGYDVELASASASKSFSEEQEATLTNFVTDNSGSYTYAEIASNFEGGNFSAKSIQGKILSMELTEHVKPAPKVETVRTYTPEEEGTFVSMVNDGSFVEEIADALGKSVNSIRGKLLSMGLKAPQRDKKSTKSDPYAGIEDMLDKTVEDIADHFDKTVRGVKTVLTRRGLQCADYNGAAKKDIG